MLKDRSKTVLFVEPQCGGLKTSRGGPSHNLLFGTTQSKLTPRFKVPITARSSMQGSGGDLGREPRIKTTTEIPKTRKELIF